MHDHKSIQLEVYYNFLNFIFLYRANSDNFRLRPFFEKFALQTILWCSVKLEYWNLECTMITKTQKTYPKIALIALPIPEKQRLIDTLIFPATIHNWARAVLGRLNILRSTSILCHFFRSSPNTKCVEEQQGFQMSPSRAILGLRWPRYEH